MTTTKKTTTNAKKNTAKQVAENIRQSNVALLGELICWNTRSNDQTIRQIDVIEALKAAELDEKVARELLPRQAFSRAMKQMQDDRLISEVSQTSDEIVFQLTKTFIETHGDNSELKFKTETFIKLNKETGALTCSDSEVMKLAQGLMDQATERRTTNDISKIVQTLFSRSADLFPIRDQGGVYFVPLSHQLFVDRVETFVTKLSGRLVRWPIPAGVSSAENSVKLSIAEGLSDLIAEHRHSIEGFGLTTRRETIEAAATKFKSTRLKLEAYAHLLQEKREELLAQIENGDQDLRNKVCSIATQKADAPVMQDGLMFGQSIVSVLRWMGKNGWKFADAKLAMGKLGVVVEDATLRTQLSKSSWNKKPAAELTAEQIAKLEEARTVKKEEAKPAAKKTKAKVTKKEVEAAVVAVKDQLSPKTSKKGPRSAPLSR